MADINENIGEKSLNELKAEFGDNAALFVTTDTTNFEQFESKLH